ncbi:MAG: JmjC domain-containing protein [Burkholderiales bacterium]
MADLLLGGLSPREFLDKHWQKRPLLIRNALCGCETILTRARLIDLARRPDVESRLVIRNGRRWQVLHGPFKRGVLHALPPTHWTLLIQGINQFVPQVAAVMQRFDFVPYCRLDDVMASLAAPGGGVGPHFDDYDVFLLQGQGQRRWQIGATRDKTLVHNAPLKILRRFRPTHDWLLDSGDMLYLPPAYAHCGTAQNECITLSIGFRAPAAQEMSAAFLAYLQDHIRIPGRYRDPRLAPTRNPARLDPALARWASTVLGKINWSSQDVAHWLGQYLSEPKPQVFFDPPRTPLARKRFGTALRQCGVELHANSRLLYHRAVFFINGEALHINRQIQRSLAMLADKRRLPAGGSYDEAILDLLYEWYRCGYIVPDSP